MSNGYKIWHSSGALLHEKPWGKDELHQVVWQNYPQGTFKTPTIVYKAVEGIASSQPIGNFILFSVFNFVIIFFIIFSIQTSVSTTTCTQF